MADGNMGDIEARLAEDRAELARSLDLLGTTLAPDRLKADARDLGGEIGGQLWQATRENPAAFALVGAGLALMLSGTGKRDESAAAAAAAAPPPMAVPPEEAMEGYDARVADADARMRAAASGRTMPEPGARSEPSARRLRSALDRGLEKLPPAARARVLDARRRAVAAQEEIERRAARAARRAERIASDQPIAVAAAAFGVGALVAALLPSTAREDALMGAERDALMDEATATLSRELQALRETAGGASASGRDGYAPGPHVPS